MPTRIYHGANQARGDDRQLLCRPDRADMRHQTQLGVGVGGREPADHRAESYFERRRRFVAGDGPGIWCPVRAEWPVRLVSLSGITRMVTESITNPTR